MNTYLVKYPDGVVDVEEGVGPFFLAFRVNPEILKAAKMELDNQDESKWAVYGGWETRKEADIDRDELLNMSVQAFGVFRPRDVRIVRGIRWDDFESDMTPEPVLDLVAV